MTRKTFINSARWTTALATQRQKEGGTPDYEARTALWSRLVGASITVGELPNTARLWKPAPECSPRKRPRKVRSVTIIGRRWFDRRYGNTYCTAQVMVNGALVHTVAEEYGYGDMYQQLALEQVAHLLPAREAHEALWRWSERCGFAFFSTAADVARRRDL